MDENNDLSYMEETPSITTADFKVLSNIKSMAEHLKKLALDVEAADLALKEAQKEYDSYRFNVLPTAMLSAGLQQLTLEDGSTISIKNKFYCNPNKNDADRQIIGAWLKDNGAEHLIKRTAIVDGAQIENLKKSDVPYVEKWDMNTNSLKAWIKSQLGADGGEAQFSIQDIPDCVHFSQIDEAEIKI